MLLSKVFRWGFLPRGWVWDEVGEFNGKFRCPARVPEQQSGCEGSSGGGLEVVMRVASKVSSFIKCRYKEAL